MGYSGKVLLCAAVIVCVLQAISARPHADGNFLESVRFDLQRKCTSLERDVEKETMNIKHKLAKEKLKLLKKAVKEGSAECVESAELQAEEQLEEKTQEIQDCINELRESLESELQPEAAYPEIMAFRNAFKNKLQVCKKSGKNALKSVQNNFSVEGKSCLV